ncbi:hypothetical protein EYF80_007732 [Liparis tanakae]|uniref:Uncharacterized protein n=1 Tax=Liparis tanakae TaxID=230148 RepID=A0A4Z2IW23_9TELE|nr:hypothetical protein EYF80_007732 [Liparis tanakae]
MRRPPPPTLNSQPSPPVCGGMAPPSRAACKCQRGPSQSAPKPLLGLIRLKFDTMTGTGKAMTSTPLREQMEPNTFPTMVFGTMSPYLKHRKQQTTVATFAIPRADMGETRRWMARSLSTLQRRKRSVGMTECQFPSSSHVKPYCARTGTALKNSASCRIVLQLTPADT